MEVDGEERILKADRMKKSNSVSAPLHQHFSWIHMRVVIYNMVGMSMILHKFSIPHKITMTINFMMSR